MIYSSNREESSWAVGYLLFKIFLISIMKQFHFLRIHFYNVSAKAVKNSCQVFNQSTVEILSI